MVRLVNFIHNRSNEIWNAPKQIHQDWARIKENMSYMEMIIVDTNIQVEQSLSHHHIHLLGGGFFRNSLCP
jgi:hypothetical protein